MEGAQEHEFAHSTQPHSGVQPRCRLQHNATDQHKSANKHRTRDNPTDADKTVDHSGSQRLVGRVAHVRQQCVER